MACALITRSIRALRQLHVHLLPERVDAAELGGSTAVVIDVLRATTTIAYALAAGARDVLPCLTIDDARAMAANLPRGQVLLAGERGGLPIVGFDLGNSPAEFTPEVVAGKTVVMTTTNGTKALLHCRNAARILAGSFANLSAICSAVEDGSRVDLVCAGTDGQVTDEDLLVAGAIVTRLAAESDWQLSPEAEQAARHWREVMGTDDEGQRSARLLAAMRSGLGGRNLVEIGMAADIALAAQIDRVVMVPRFDAATGRITPEQ